MTRTYKLISQPNLTTAFKVDNRVVVVTFCGGVKGKNSITYGTYTTSDPELQHAIEHDAGYGNEFCLSGSFTDSDVDSKKESNDITEEELTRVEGVNNKQLAIIWLEENLKLSLVPTSNVAQIKQVALDNKIIFTDWK